MTNGRRKHAGSVSVYLARAGVTPKGRPPANVTGKWSEVYLKQGGVWTMISISGRPDMPEKADMQYRR
jgi:hypothetical protein